MTTTNVENAVIIMIKFTVNCHKYVISGGEEKSEQWLKISRKKNAYRDEK